MKKFIFLTFGFLGFAFYNMSGGADFEPASARLATEAQLEVPVVKVAKIRQPASQPKAVQTAQAAPRIEPTQNTSSVTRVSLNLTTLTDAGATLTDAGTTTTQHPLPENVIPLSNGSVIASKDTPAIIPSLIVPNDTGAAIQQGSAPIYDIREVTGNRVNVRGGPGTDYGVVSKLLRGDTVEVLEDRGDGWVRMRPMDGGPVGWMADFLLTSG